MGDVSAALERYDPRPERWSNRHDLVVLLKATGHRNNEIAEKLDYSQAYVSLILGDPRAKQKLEEYTQRLADNAIDVRAKLDLLSAEAIETAAHWMRERKDQLAPVSLRSAFGILDRAGYSKVEKHLVGHVELPLDRLKAMEKQAGAANRALEEFDYGREVVVESEEDNGKGGTAGGGTGSTP
ncbi:MAG: hypothetical protein GTO63_30210 [Anaerolineae bacterium]|nr:hypothetical protein [Anaerolineae bacterium]NIN98979.1 hypothetical protein [Anaerolineae bacterium]